jgi:hypothetical protein
LFKEILFILLILSKPPSHQRLPPPHIRINPVDPWLKQNFKNSAFFPPVGFSPSWKCDQLLRVKAWIMSVARDRFPRPLAKAEGCGPTAATVPAALSAASVHAPTPCLAPNKLETLITLKLLDTLLNY